jgi:8-oxo-dGTP pyrophosphatase MutT (NUDIX family)/AcrR family transcriptional regulator
VARDDRRRAELADAALRVLAREGSRGLTHCAVDEEAGVPTGTASNYFRSRPALIGAVAERLTVRLAPEAAVLERLGAAVPSRAIFAAHLRDVVRRLTRHRDLMLALFELRLEAARRPELRGLPFTAPAGRAEIALLHYALTGLLLDRLTVSVDPDTSTDHVVDTLVAALLPATPPIMRPRAVAYVVRDGDVLVFTHRPTPCTEGAGLQVPGGGVHDGEDPAVAVVREVREETGLDVEIVRPLGTVTRGGRELHHFHVAPLGPTPDAWDHDERSDGDVPLWTFSLFWLPVPVARRAIDHGMGDLLDML